MVWKLIIAATVALTTATAALTAGTTQCEKAISDSYPHQYISYFTPTAPKIDGDLNEPVWNEVDSTTRFVDISTSTLPSFSTHAKVRHDDHWVYVGATIDDPHVWANITHTCHCIDPNQDQVLFHGNNFEVFFDTDGTCHNYKEFEINAANAVWDMIVTKPYQDGGVENSTRVDGKNGFDMMPPLTSSVRIAGGRINDPASGATGWSVEIAFPIDKVVVGTTTSPNSPSDGTFWRMNFARVEWHVKDVNNKYWLEPSCQSCANPGTRVADNWVWSPMGQVNMHMPEVWGLLQFSSRAPKTAVVEKYGEWPVRYTAHVLYYAMRSYATSHGGAITTDVKVLMSYTDQPSVLAGECTALPTIIPLAHPYTYSATIRSGKYELTMRSDRLITVRTI